MTESENEFLIISSSLNKASRSKILAELAGMRLKNHGHFKFLDLREVELPLCDGDEAYAHPNVEAVRSLVHNASGIIVAIPVYNYAAGAAIKNLVELTGRAWTDKVVGFLCAAGGKSSYMSVMGLANSLMLDFRCLIIPRFVYADSGSFDERKLSDDKVFERIDMMVDELVRVSRALQSPTP